MDFYRFNKIKYAVACDYLYNVAAFFIVCTLLGFIAWLCYKTLLALFSLIQYITNKVTKYNDVHTKAQYKDTSFEIDLHEQDKNRSWVGQFLIYYVFILFHLINTH